MEHRSRKYLAPELRKQLWKLRRKGLTLAEIGKALDVRLNSVWLTIARTGGIEPRTRRRQGALSELERKRFRGASHVACLWKIASKLGRAPSTIAREVRRNTGRSGYRACIAEQRASKRARRPKPCKLVQNARLRNYVAAKLQLNWSPQQIAKRLRATFGNSVSMRVSHETIYRTLYVQARGALKKELVAHLRSGRKYRQTRGTQKIDTQSIVDGISISERPAEVEDRAVPGHWEGDLLFWRDKQLHRHARRTKHPILFAREGLEQRHTRSDGRDTEANRSIAGPGFAAR